jgi:hypothetical protein
MTVDPFESAPAVPVDDDDPFEAAGGIGGPELIEEHSGYRYMPDPLTGRRKRFTRASGFAMSDEFVLNEWKLAFVAMGVAKDRGLYAEANSMPLPTESMEFRPKGWWRPWAKIAHEAMDFMGAKTGARLGSAVHRWSEQYELGTLELKSVPPEWRKHVEALVRLRAREKMTLIPSLRERLILNRGLHNGVCGRFDAITVDAFGRLVIDDTKTGKNVPAFGLEEISIQLSIYANAEWMWEPESADTTHGYAELPDIDKTYATVTWLPIDRPEDSELIPVDIAAGWEAAQHVAALVQHRNRSRRKHDNLRLSMEQLYSVPELDNTFTGVRLIREAATVDQLRGIVTNLFSQGLLTAGVSLMAQAKEAEINAEAV